MNGFSKREVVGSKPVQVSFQREDSPGKIASIEGLVEKTRCFLRTIGPSEEKDILKGINLNHSQVSALVHTTLGVHLLEEHKGFHCVKEDDREFYYLSDEDSDVAFPDISVTTTTASTNTLAAAAVDASIAGPQNPSDVRKSWCMDPENSSCSNSAYESAEDEEAWAVSTSITAGSEMSRPLVSALVATCTQETQTEPPVSFWRSVEVMTAPASCASVHTQTEQPDEGTVLRMVLKKRDIDIFELQETLQMQSGEHRKEIQQLHNRISDLQMQLQMALEEKQALPSVKQRAVPVEPEIHSLLVEPKVTTASPTTNGDCKAMDKTEIRDFYELQMMLEQNCGGGSCSDVESVCSSYGGTSKRSKRTEQEENIISKVKREKPNFTESYIREYLNKFREKQCGLTGLTVKAIVAGILALMKSDALSTRVPPHNRRCTTAPGQQSQVVLLEGH